MSAPRIVSLLPSATEMVCALGFRDALVGRSHECDFPPGVDALPICTRPRIDVGASSRAIDDGVRLALQESSSIYAIDEDLIRSLAPDVVVTQAQCEVCAVSEADVRTVVAKIATPPPRIVALSATSLEGIWTDIVEVGNALGVTREATRLVTSLQDRVVRTADRRNADRTAPPPTVLALEWLDPLMTAGNWIPELVHAAGGTSLGAAAGRHSEWIDWATVAAADPDVVVVMPCGFDLPRVRIELPALTRRTGWNELRAVREKRVYLADGNQYFNRPGPRIAESAEILAEILYPRSGPTRWRGSAWEAFE